jgi:hypothetical protein
MTEPRRLELIEFVINLITGVLLIRYWGWAPFLLAVVMVLGQMVIGAYRYNSWRRTVGKAGAMLDENIRLKRTLDKIRATNQSVVLTNVQWQANSGNSALWRHVNRIEHIMNGDRHDRADRIETR